MARDASGNWIPLAPVVGGTVITSTWANNMMTSFGADVTESLDRSGRGGMLVPFRIADGTKLEPGYSWTAELSTGFYRDLGGFDMRTSVGGKDIFRWNANGAQISYDDGVTWNAVVTEGGGGGQTGVNVGTAEGQTLYWDEATDKVWKPTSLLTIDAVGGFVGINTLTPSAPLQVTRPDIGIIGQFLGDTADDLKALSISAQPDVAAVPVWNDSLVIEGNAGAGGIAIGESSGLGPIKFYGGASRGERMRIMPNGTVGIGTTDPNSLLVVSDSGAEGYEIDPVVSPGAILTQAYDRVAAEYIGITHNALVHDFQTGLNGQLAAMRITENQDVGIGINTPVRRLDVYEDGTTASLRVGNNQVLGAYTTYEYHQQFNTLFTLTTGPIITLSAQGAAPDLRINAGGPADEYRINASTHIHDTYANSILAQRIDAAGNTRIGEITAGSNNASLVIGGHPAAALTQPTAKSQLCIAQGTTIDDINDGGGIDLQGSVFGAGYGGKITSLDVGGLLFGTRSNNAAWTERMRIDPSTGNVGVGAAASAGARLETRGSSSGSGSQSLYCRNSGASSSFYVRDDFNLFCQILSGSNGPVYAAGGFLTLNNPSDATLKENIVPVPYGLAAINALNPVSFTWKENAEIGDTVEALSHDSSPQFGLIAQDVQAVIPELVSDAEWGLGLKSDQLVPILVAAIQELTARVEALGG